MHNVNVLKSLYTVLSPRGLIPLLTVLYPHIHKLYYFLLKYFFNTYKGVNHVAPFPYTPLHPFEDLSTALQKPCVVMLVEEILVKG